MLSRHRGLWEGPQPHTRVQCRHVGPPPTPYRPLPCPSLAWLEPGEPSVEPAPWKAARSVNSLDLGTILHLTQADRRSAGPVDRDRVKTRLEAR